jgi:hypothetical protein
MAIIRPRALASPRCWVAAHAEPLQRLENRLLADAQFVGQIDDGNLFVCQLVGHGLLDSVKPMLPRHRSCLRKGSA